ncbi:MAG TPA: PIN domain-containing protein [Gemmataceae bacterium]|nr:PIN domain-containing protein [Gemmataceae bacterium]
MSTDPVIFIDANQYLLLYGMVEGKKLLDALEEQKEHVFVSRQIVHEVERNKLNAAKLFFVEQFKRFATTQFGMPDHLFGMSEEQRAEITQQIKTLADHAANTKSQLVRIAGETLLQISRSEDEVSRRLKKLYDQAIIANEKEMERARDRKERGNPPGYSKNPLGDQLSWEQFLSRCKGIKGAWIITNDGDFVTKYDGAVLLNPLLCRELSQVMSAEPQIHCFDNLADGIRHFGQNSGVKAEKLPTEKEVEQIKKEQESLPSLSPSRSGLTLSQVIQAQENMRTLWPQIAPGLAEYMSRTQTALQILSASLAPALMGINLPLLESIPAIKPLASDLPGKALHLDNPLQAALPPKSDPASLK